MTTLPISVSYFEPASRFVSIYSVGCTEISPLIARKFTSGQSLAVPWVIADLDSKTSVCLLTENDLDQRILDVSDAVILILDAAVGISAQAISTWQTLQDLEVPTLLVATNLFATHTDFDELVAIAQRVFNNNILVRYLPMSNESETEIVALFDLLTNQILDYSDCERDVKSPDSEHLELTADQREKLLEQLAFLGLSDEKLAMFRSGIIPAIGEFDKVWETNANPSITALDELAGLDLILDWISHCPNRWEPMVEPDDHQTHISSPSFFGYGIVPGLARTWGVLGFEIEVTRDSGEHVSVKAVQPYASCVLSSAILPNDTIHESGRSVNLVLPAFD